MNAATENSTEETVGTTAAEKPFSVYSISFKEIINDAEREFLVERTKGLKLEKPVKQKGVSKAIFNWRNAIAVTAILAIGVLHFAFQMMFIQSETTKNMLVEEVPLKIEPVAQPPVEASIPSEFEVEKVDTSSPKKMTSVFKSPEAESTPAKPVAKKKETPETSAERLRRAEKLLTGF